MQRIAVQDRRAALLAAAVRVIARDGAARASVRAIAAEADMPTASVHYAFASHSALLEQLVAELLEEQRAHIAAEVASAASLAEFAEAALQAWLDRATQQPDVERALHELIGLSRSMPGLDAVPATVYAEYQRSADGFVRAAAARFGVRWRVEDADVARFVLVVTDGVAARWLVDGDETAARRALRLGAGALAALAVTP